MSGNIWHTLRTSVCKMQPPTKRFLLVDQRFRRYSAPDDFRSGFGAKSYTSEESEDESRKSRVSVIDLSILFEDHSGSDSSLELDTSTSRTDTPRPSGTFSCDIRLAVPSQCYDCQASGPHANPWVNFISSWPTWRTVLTLQILSLVISVINITMENISLPLSVNALNLPQYIYLSLVWSTQLAMREGSRGIIQVTRLSGLRYIFLALLHVEASTLALLTLSHQTLIGNQMMDCVAATLSLIVAFVCLEVEFQLTHLSGFAIAFLGSMGMCISVPPGEDVDDAVWGDIVRFGSGIFFCFNSLAEEIIVKSIDTVEYLGMVGLIGSFICALQTIAMDKDKPWPTDTDFWLQLLILSVMQFSFNSLVPRILRDVGATGMHLSLITSPFYHLLIQNRFQFASAESGLIMLLSYLLIVGGSYVFALKRTSINKHYFYPVRVTLPRTES